MADNPIKKGNTQAREFSRYIRIGAMFVVGLYFLYLLVMLISVYFSLVNWNTLGTVGDSFGAINALFSGVALIGIVVALIYQRREVGSQLEALQKSVKHQSDQATALAKQLFWTSQAEVLKTNRELVVLGLSNDEYTSWMEGQDWSRGDRYIQLWMNAYFLAWQANDLDLEWGSDYWEAGVNEINLFFTYEVTRTWWSQVKPYYPKRFVEAIDKLVGTSADGETNEGAASSQ